ncbi:DUF3272 family protein [Streptococcus himalayensis]|nr:DUF3272 family protein [Streptococcus himalayensis]
MNKRQLILMAIFTAIETYYFNEAMMAEQYLIAGFWGFLVARNLQVSYVMSKIVATIDRHIQKRK